jgi:iron complex outermembrane receptor protein
MDINGLQATETAGSCSSRVVLNVEKSRSVGAEADFAYTPNEHFDLDLNGSITDATMRTTFESSGGDLGIHEGNRLPSVPKYQFTAAATYQWQVRSGSLGYVNADLHYVGSRYTQVGDEQTCTADGVCSSLGTLNMNSFGANTIGGPLTQSTFLYDPLLPSYTIINARIGVRREKWDVSVYGNNLGDERAFLALDRERGTRARIGYLTNQPRTFGISTRIDF